MNSTLDESFVSIIIPAYKEEELIEETLIDVINSMRRSQFRFEVIVVLDKVKGDRTSTIVNQLCNKFYEIKLIEREGKRGVGNAIRTGIRLAKGDIIVPMMGDHSESSLDLIRLVEAVNEGCDMAIGNRFKLGRPIGYPLLKYIANRCFNFLIKILFLFPSSDITNAFKAYRARILYQIDISSIGFEVFVEIPIKFYFKGAGIKVTDISIKHFVREKKEAKLSLLRDGPRYIKIIPLLVSRR